MFRRGSFRRPPGQGAPIGEAGRAALIRANQLNEAGQYLKAAEIFERVAKRMENRLRPNRAAFLFLQASHSLLMAKHIDQSMELSKRALALLAQYQHWRAYLQGGNMLVLELNQVGYTKEAAEIQTLLDQHKLARLEQVHGAGPSQPLPKPTLRLPGKCPSCGAPLRSDMAEWIDSASAECPYCGSVIQAE
jgi:tetratricopeptide (TPR) repeat protein